MERSSKMRLMVCSDSLNQTTGFSYVISSILRRLIETGQYDILYVTLTGIDTTREGLAIQGSRFAKAAESIQLANAQVNDKKKALTLDSLIEKFAPEVVLTSHDPWYLDTIAYSAYRDSFYWAAYLTVEVPEYPEFVMSSSPILPTSRKPIKDIMSKANLVIPHTQMGYDMLTKHWKLDNVAQPCYSGLDFDEACTEDVLKSEVFGPSCLEDDFVFMTMGVNSDRKRLDRIIDAFSKFHQKHPGDKYKLYLHTDINVSMGGTDLNTMVADLDLLDNLLVSTTYRAGTGIDKVDLYRRYKACDCYIGLPAGEGFGYGFAEALMHGKPVIYIDHGGHTCYLKGIGLPVKVKDYTTARNAYIKWALADTDDAARAMARVVSDKKYRESSSRRGYEFAKTYLDWEVTFKQFHATLLSEYHPHEINMLAGVPMRRLV